jgi:hypothetical protein
MFDGSRRSMTPLELLSAIPDVRLRLSNFDPR